MRMLLLAVAAFGLAMMAGGEASAQAATELKPGDPAPPFSLPGSDGKIHRLADYEGRAVVLAWFPLAFSGG
jgi:thioredoxin-dependent peroxiredoxin